MKKFFNNKFFIINEALAAETSNNKTNKRVMLKDKMSLEDIQKLDGMRSLEITKKINSLF